MSMLFLPPLLLHISAWVFFFFFTLTTSSLSPSLLIFPLLSLSSIPEDSDNLNRLFSTCSVESLVSLFSPVTTCCPPPNLPSLPSSHPLFSLTSAEGLWGPSSTPGLICVTLFQRSLSRQHAPHIGQLHTRLPGNATGKQPLSQRVRSHGQLCPHVDGEMHAVLTYEEVCRVQHLYSHGQAGRTL